MSSDPTDRSMTTRTRAFGLALAAATTVVLWQFTAGRYLLYPFTILASWFHEMGHGLCAMLLGGSFVSLSLFPDGSGYAVHSGSRFFGRPGLALVAAAGPLGPALAGALLIFFSLRPKRSRLGLTGMAVVMLLSALIWIRTLFGVSVIGLLALLLLLIRFKGTDRWHSLTLQFIGVQASISVFLSIDYLFTEKVRVSGRLVYSDTGQIAAALFLPYWFWAILLTGLTLWLPAWSPARALRATGRSS
jgi:hypothetical protein